MTISATIALHPPSPVVMTGRIRTIANRLISANSIVFSNDAKRSQYTELDSASAKVEPSAPHALMARCGRYLLVAPGPAIDCWKL